VCLNESRKSAGDDAGVVLAALDVALVASRAGASKRNSICGIGEGHCDAAYNSWLRVTPGLRMA
jgi:hypothetical protein